MKGFGKHIIPGLLFLSLIFMAGCGGGGGGNGGNGGGGNNTAPQIISAPKRYAQENTAYTYQVSAIDPDGDAVSYSLTTAPTGTAINSSTGAISWTPTSDQGGEHSVEVTASDGRASSTQAYTVEVQTTTVVASQFISATAGGTVEVSDQTSDLAGTTVVIPPNALPEDTTVTIGEVSNPSYLVEGAVAIDLGPSMTFSAPVTITLPYTDEFLNTFGISDETQLAIFTFDETTQSWEEIQVISVDPTTNTITGQVDHFSLFAVAIDFMTDLDQPTALIEEKGSIPGFRNNTGKNLLIIHGIFSSESSFTSSNDFIEYFKTNGDYANILFYNYPSGDLIERNASELYNQIQFGNPVAVEFDIVAHSMGGLVARCLIERCYLPEEYKITDEFKVNVEHLFMVGTPNFGAPLELLAESYPIIDDIFIEDNPGIEELLPTSDFISRILNPSSESEEVIASRGSTKYYWLTGDIGASIFASVCPEGSFQRTDGVVCAPTSTELSFLGLDESTARTFGPSDEYEHTALHEQCAINGICDEIMAALGSEPTTFTLNVGIDGSGSGTVTGSGISCPGDCSETYSSGANVTLTASADSGSVFSGWSGACPGTDTCTVTMDAGKSVTATFDLAPPNTYTLTINKAGTGSGTVTSNPAGINCGGTCQASFDDGTGVSLSAIADSGSTFAGWSGDPDCTDGSVTMDSDKTCTATFNTVGTAPSAPTGVAADAGDGQVTISWNAVTGADSYNLYWGTSPGVTKTTGTKITGVTSPYTHTGRTNGVTYYYVVTAENAYGESVESSEVSGTPTANAGGGVIQLPKTGQNTCYDTAGNVIDCTGTGQDGEIQAGVSWPSPRFTDNGDGTITDNLTGLMWLKDGNCFGLRTWQSALDMVADFSSNPGTYGCTDYTATYTDWRLPNVNELESLVNAGESNTATWLNGQGFTNVQPYDYWSSTSSEYNDQVALHFDIGYGDVGGIVYYKDSWISVWAVRAGQQDNPDPIYPANLWKTGQTICSDSSGNVIDCTGTGQDGNIQAGVPWPSPRFTDNSDGTAMDNLTGLMWLKDANCFGTRTWQAALDAVADFNKTPTSYDCANYDEANPPYTDWRLPNRKELHSLTDFSQYGPALPSGHPFFNVAHDEYWSSTSYANNRVNAWIVHITYGDVIALPKNFFHVYVWPVRSGQ